MKDFNEYYDTYFGEVYNNFALPYEDVDQCEIQRTVEFKSDYVQSKGEIVTAGNVAGKRGKNLVATMLYAWVREADKLHRYERGEGFNNLDIILGYAHDYCKEQDLAFGGWHYNSSNYFPSQYTRDSYEPKKMVKQNEFEEQSAREIKEILSKAVILRDRKYWSEYHRDDYWED